jgi:hypothetical protein
MPKATGRKLDFAERARLTVEQAIGEHLDGTPLEIRPPDLRNPHAVALGSMGGKKGGKARAKKLTASQRKQIARKAAKARWK